MNLNCRAWKPFNINKIFVIVMGNGFDKNKMTDEQPSINFVSRISYGNGVDKKVDSLDGINPFPAGTLTVALGGSYLGSCFVQEEPFYTAQNVAVMYPKFSEMSHHVKTFITALVRYECRYKYYAFGRELNTHIRKDFTISLPIKYDTSGNAVKDPNKEYSEDGFIPDWEFMENYIKSLHHKPLTTCNIIPRSFKSADNWKNFTISRIFNVEAGIYYYPDQYEEGNTPYVSASDEENGISKFISLSPDFEGNKITIGKIGATVYYQPFPFCATSDVNILSPSFEMSPYVGIFITSIINFSENYKWSYGRQCRIGDTNKIIIKLPIQCNQSGQPIIDELKKFSDEGYIPDWEYMENYIKSLPYGDRLAEIVTNED